MAGKGAKRAPAHVVAALRRLGLHTTEELAKKRYVELAAEKEARIKAGVENPSKVIDWYKRECEQVKAAHDLILEKLAKSGRSGK